MKGEILLVEDSKEIYNMVNLSIGSAHNLAWSETLAGALEKISSTKYDLILLDIELPDGSGYDFCSHVQSKLPDASVFFLTSKTDLSEKVLGFSAGADDYITKPFQGLELKARVDSKILKKQLKKDTELRLEWDTIEINMISHEVKVFVNGSFEKVDLTSLELKILVYLAQRVNEVVPRDKILDDIWGKDVHVYSRSVDTHVSKLRKKLDPVSHIIESVHGTGYKFTP